MSGALTCPLLLVLIVYCVLHCIFKILNSSNDIDDSVFYIPFSDFDTLCILDLVTPLVV